MDRKSDYRGLRFDSRQRIGIPRRLRRPLAVILAMGIFSLLWTILSGNALFWVLLIVFGIIFWAASYGWREALQALQGLLRQLEQM